MSSSNAIQLDGGVVRVTIPTEDYEPEVAPRTTLANTGGATRIQWDGEGNAVVEQYERGSNAVPAPTGISAAGLAGTATRHGTPVRFDDIQDTDLVQFPNGSTTQVRVAIRMGALARDPVTKLVIDPRYDPEVEARQQARAELERKRELLQELPWANQEVQQFSQAYMTQVSHDVQGRIQAYALGLSDNRDAFDAAIEAAAQELGVTPEFASRNIEHLANSFVHAVLQDLEQTVGFPASNEVEFKRFKSWVEDNGMKAEYRRALMEAANSGNLTGMRGVAERYLRSSAPAVQGVFVGRDGYRYMNHPKLGVVRVDVAARLGEL